MSYKLYEALKNGATATELEKCWKSELTAAVKRIEYEEQIEKETLRYKETREKAVKAMFEYMKIILNIMGTEKTPDDRLMKLAENFFNDFENDFSMRLYNATVSKIMELDTKEKAAGEQKCFNDKNDLILKAFIKTLN